MALFELPPWLVERIEYLLDPMRLLCVVLVLKFLHRVFVDFKVPPRGRAPPAGTSRRRASPTRRELPLLHRLPQLGQSTGQAEQLEREAKALRMQAAVMAVPSTFAKAAKMERQAIALEKEAERQRQAAGTPSAVARAAKVGQRVSVGDAMPDAGIR